jgi:ribonuclease-3
MERYHQALTHSTYAKEMRDIGQDVNDNERMEFLGDRVLNLIIAEYLFRNDEQDEGALTRKMVLASNRKIANHIRKNDQDFIECIKIGQGVEKITDKMISSAFESFVAAIYLDQKIPPVRKYVLQHYAIDDFIEIPQHPKNEFQELMVGFGHSNPKYETNRIGGDEHEPIFRSTVKIVRDLQGIGTGGNRTEAETKAAEDALRQIYDLIDGEEN